MSSDSALTNGRATILALCYAGLTVAWQTLLWMALPNVGMGALAIVYLVWPALAISAIGLWLLLKRAGGSAMLVFALGCAVMILGTTLLHPQDSQTGFMDKIRAILAL